MSENFEIYEEAPDHKWRTEVPNILFELELDPYELSVYLYLKKIAGDDGRCYYSKKNLSKHCKISERKLDLVKKKLSTSFKALKGLPLITIHKRMKVDKSWETDLITITPIWRINGNYYREKQQIKKQLTGARHAPPLVHDMHHPGAPHAPKEELEEEDQQKTTNPKTKPKRKKAVAPAPAAPPPAASGVVVSILDKVDLSLSQKLKIAKEHTDAEILSAFEKMEKTKDVRCRKSTFLHWLKHPDDFEEKQQPQEKKKSCSLNPLATSDKINKLKQKHADLLESSELKIFFNQTPVSQGITILGTGIIKTFNIQDENNFYEIEEFLDDLKTKAYTGKKES